MSEIKVGDRFEWRCETPGNGDWAKGESYAVVSIIEAVDGDTHVMMESGMGTTRAVVRSDCEERYSFRRLPSQPAKVEPQEGQRWRSKRGEEVTLRKFDGRRWDTDTHYYVLKEWFEEATLISDTPQKAGTERVGSVQPTVCDWVMTANGLRCKLDSGHDGRCSFERLEGRGESVHRAGYPVERYSEGRIESAMHAHNDAFHDKQKAAILANYLEQQSNPWQPRYHGQVAGPGWFQRGYGRK